VLEETIGLKLSDAQRLIRRQLALWHEGAQHAEHALFLVYAV